MKYRTLHPEQIITLRDYPLYNEHILRIYFRVFSKDQGKILPPCPVIHKSKGIPFASGQDAKSIKYNDLLKDFLDKNHKAEYFLLDGSHKTTAATLSGKMIPVVIVEQDEDLKVAQELIKSGEFFGWYSVKDTIQKMIDELTKHHIETERFMTVADKTKLLVDNKDIPDYIINYFKNSK